MEKEIFIKKIIDEDDRGIRRNSQRGLRDGHNMHEGRRGSVRLGRNNDRNDKGRGNHIDGGRRDGQGPHLEEGCNTVGKKSQSYRGYNRNHVTKTKMFTSKKELVEYVNKVGELGNKIDIYKIEDDLYKVVIIERYKEVTKETL